MSTEPTAPALAWTPAQLREARELLQRRAEVEQQEWRELHARAVSDCSRIVAMLREEFSPTLILQWGSLLDPARFRPFSDIDLAVAGLADPARFFDALGRAQALTRFPIDLVQLEKISPEKAFWIRQNGRVLHES